MTEDKYKPQVYFDTNALNYLCDRFKGRSKKTFRKFNIFLSWPMLDEINCNPSFSRTIDLADFIWFVSNKKILLTVKDLVSLEVKSYIKDFPLSLSDYFDHDNSYINAINDARKGKMPIQIRTDLRSNVSGIKDMTKLWERSHRKKWMPYFGTDKPLPNNWESFYPKLSQENYFNEVLYDMIETYGLAPKYEKQNVSKIDHRKLSCLSIGIEFFGALQFIIDSQSRKLGKPDRGDLLDMQHAFYVGLCDFFITSDERVLNILKMIKGENTVKIIKAEDFCKNYLLSEN